MVSTDVEKDSIHNHDEREPSSTNNSIGPLEKALSCPDEQQPAVDPSAAGPPLSPDGGFGWVCVACVFFINAHTWGLNSVRQSIYNFLPILTHLTSSVIWCFPLLLSLK